MHPLKNLHPSQMAILLVAAMILVGGAAASDQFSPETPLLWSYDVENSNEEIESIAISDDGNYIVIGTWSWDEKGLYLFSKDNNTSLWKYLVDGGVTSVGISSDGSYLVASDSYFPNPDIYLFGRSSNTPLWSYSPEFGVGSIAISGDGSYIAAAESGGSLGETRKLYLFNKSSSTPLWAANLSAGGGANVSISHDGNVIVVGGTQLYLFDKSTNTPLWTFQPSGSIANVSISADGLYVAVGTVGETPNVYLFHKSSSTPIWNYETSATVSISSDGNYVTAASSSYSGGPQGFLLWQKDSNNPQWTYPTTEAPADISISNSGNRIAGVESGVVYLFSKDSSESVWYYGSSFERASMAGDGNFIAASERHRFSLLDASFEVPSEVWVDDDYCDTCANDGHTWGYDAFGIIQEAVDVLWTGGTVHVASGTYSETAVYRGGDYEYTAVFIDRDNVKLVGEGMDTAIIDSDQEANRIIITGKGCEVKGFTIKNSGWGYRGIYLARSGGHHIISGNTILNNGTGIELSQAGDSMVENNIITYNDTGISNQDSHGTVFFSNIIAHNDWGITSHSNNTVIKNCVIAQNGSGIRTEYTSGDIFVNNTVADNDVGIYMFTCFSSITNSIIWGNENELNISAGGYLVTHCNVEGGWPGMGNTSLHPAFVDAANGDYHLQSYSSCIGIGTPSGAPDTDIEGNQRPNPPGSNPDVGAYEHSLAIPEVPPLTVLNVFGLEVGNKWVYQGTDQGNPYTVEREITRLDQTTFPAPVSVMEIKENGVYAGAEFYEDTGNQLKYWGETGEDEGEYYNAHFSNSLLVAWFPAEVGEHNFSSTSAVFTELPGYSFNVSCDVEVVGKESVTLGFDTLEAYRMRYQMRVWDQGLGLDETETFTWWVVPHIGVIKDERLDSVVELTSFAIGGGAITEASDGDDDDLTDYQELFTYQTHWQYPDTDGDTCDDGAEVMGGRNPLLSDPQGDLNMDCAFDLKDAIDALRFVELMDGSSIPGTKGDVNGDGQIGLEDACFVIQKIGGLK